MFVLAEDAAEAIASSYVEAAHRVAHRVAIADCDGQRAQRAGVRDALVWM
jgi:hypothetical protein